MSRSHGELSGRRRTAVPAILITAACVGALGAASSIAAQSEKKDKEPSRTELQQKLDDARKRLDAAAQEVAHLSMSLSEDVWPGMRRFAFSPANRAMLGANIGSGGADASSDGVEILSVSPGGAAAEAGLKAGDVLTELNGKSLKRSDDQSPREKLMSGMRDVKPGDKIAVTYRRDGKAAKTTLVAQPMKDRMFSMAVPPMHGAMGSGPMGMPTLAFMRSGGVFGSAELVPLTPKLGQYFGTEKGLLVVRAPEDSRFQLEDGDVIVDIDGRTPSSATHALRILSSYQPGEKLKLNVLRARKNMSFDITIPEDAWERHFNGASFHWPPHDVVMPAPGIPAAPRIHALPPAAAPGLPMPAPAPAPTPSEVNAVGPPPLEIEA